MVPSSLAPGPREHAENCGPVGMLRTACSGYAQHPHALLGSTGHEGFRACSSLPAPTVLCPAHRLPLSHSPPACAAPWTTRGWGDPSQELGPKSRAEGAGTCAQGRAGRGKGRRKGRGISAVGTGKQRVPAPLPARTHPVK